jgi:uncharacterized membrane protein YecN with MAPEG domain
MAEKFTLELTPEYGYIIAVVAAMYIAQNIIMVLPVVRQRLKTGIKAPTLYPRDHEIKTLKLSDKQVWNYMVAQRAHQNNVEFTSVFMPLFLVTGLFPAITLKVAIAGAWVVFWRVAGAVGYLFGVRQIGTPYALGAFYILYLACKQAYVLAHPVRRMSPGLACTHMHNGMLLSSLHGITA